jgi:predicted amidophosphoribosyltransferase
MALISCAECGHQMSDAAAACPQCGHPSTAIQPAQSSPSKPTGTSGQVWEWVSTIAFFVLAFALNPSEVTHRAKLRGSVAENHPVASIFGAAHVAALDGRYHSFGLASYIDNNRGVTTIGAFGYVWVLTQ